MILQQKEKLLISWFSKDFSKKYKDMNEVYKLKQTYKDSGIVI